MKKLLFLFIVFSCFSFTNPKQDSYTLTVIIEGLKETSGTVEVALYNTEETYLSEEEAYSWLKEKVTSNSVIVVFENVPKGKYTFAGYHDENNNEKMDKSLGIPKEGFFFSNNVKASFGAPDYKDALFIIDKDTEQKVTLQYVF